MGALLLTLSLAGTGTRRAGGGGLPHQPTPKQSLLGSTEPTLPEVPWNKFLFQQMNQTPGANDTFGAALLRSSSPALGVRTTSPLQ